MNGAGTSPAARWHPRPRSREVSVEWYTPPAVFQALGLSFDLDPASPPHGLPWVPARRFYWREGLRRPWFGLVWLNPPYGSGAGPWLERMAQHGEGVALVYARTETEWFQQAVHQAAALCFVDGRLRFIRPGEDPYELQPVERRKSGTPAGSVLFGYGAAAAGAVLRCGLGWATRL